MHKLVVGMAAVLTLALAVVVTPGVASPQKVTVQTKLTENGLGPIRVGMTLRQARAATGQKIDVVGHSQSAHVVALLDAQLDTKLYLDDGRISYVLIGSPSRPAGGLLSRFPELALPQLRHTFGQVLHSAPSTIVPQGTDYWVDTPGHPGRSLVYTFKDGDLRLIAGGLLPTSRYPGEQPAQ